MTPIIAIVAVVAVAVLALVVLIVVLVRRNRKLVNDYGHLQEEIGEVRSLVSVGALRVPRSRTMDREH